MEQDNQIAIYQTEDGQTRIDVRLEDETVWLTANQMAVLFDRDEKTLRKHINNVFREGELERINNTHFLRVDGVKQTVACYNLDGNEKDESFKSSIGQIYQTFDGVELYPSVEEKAAMLLYLVTKNHSFSDGNKRIAATLFLWFLNNNGVLYRADGTKRIANNTLVALTLMIAESKAEEKDVMVKVVVNLINQRNDE